MQIEDNELKVDKDLKKLCNVIEKFYKHKAKLEYTDLNKRELHFVLYQSFKVVFGLDERYNTFGAGIFIGPDCCVSHNILGERVSLNSDKESVIKSLGVIDEYCQLRLPDKFLIEFDKKMKNSY